MKNIEIQLSESARVKELMISSCTQSIQNAADLIKSGWKEGPKIGQELKRLRNIELEKIESKNVSF